MSAPGWIVTWKVEVARLSAQARVRFGVLACIVGPPLFVAVLSAQSSVPSDTLFGRWVHESGFAIPLVILGFAGQWGLPVLISIVAGDIFATEDTRGTWPTLLTRSRSREEIAAGKVLAALTWTSAVVVLLAASSVAAGVLLVGTQPLVSLSGNLLSGSTATAVVLASWATVLLPAFAITAIAVLVSALARNSWVGVGTPVVIVLALQLVALLSAVDPIRPALPTSGFEAWHGLARIDRYTGPLAQSAITSAVWIVLGVGGAVWIVRRRDVAPR